MTEPATTIVEVADEENGAMAAGDAARCFAILADDCSMIPPNAEPKSGAELRNWLKEFLDLVDIVSLNYEHGDTVVAGDWAWHQYRCQWRVTPRAGGPSSTPRFNGLHVLRRESDGAWKIVREIWNTAPAGQ